MNPAFFIPAAAQTTTSLLQYFLRKKPPRYEETARGKYMMGQSRYGRYSPQARRSILGDVSRATGGVAQQEKASIRGLLTSRGLGDSIAGIRLLSEPEIKRMAILGDVEERLGRESELSKGRAREAFATERTGYGEQRRAGEQQARTSLLSGLTQAGMQGYRGYELGKLAGTEVVDPKTGKITKPYEALTRATAAGIRIPYGGMKYFMGGQEKQPFDLPEGFVNFSTEQLAEWAKNAGMNYETARQIQDDMFKEWIQQLSAGSKWGG